MAERLEQEPQSGKPLRGKLHGLWQLRIGPFRVWYEINEEQKKATLRAMLHKDEARSIIRAPSGTLSLTFLTLPFCISRSLPAN
jgi:plasmid stabilization system protein ParE